MPEPINAKVARLIRRVNAASANGDHQVAQQIAREAVNKAAMNTHKPTQTAAHYTLAAALWADQNASAQEAREHVVKALDLELARQYTEEYYLSLTLLARIDAGLGNLENAQAINEKLLVTFRRKNQRRGIAEILRNLGDLALKQNDLIAARDHFVQSLTLYEDGEVNDPLSHGGLLLSMGTLAYHEGDLVQAEARWQQAQALGTRHDMPQILESARQGLEILAEEIIAQDEQETS